MDAIFTELLKVLPFGQAVGLILLLFILKVLMQSRDKLNEVVGRQKALEEKMDDHQDQDDKQFDKVDESIRELHHRLDGRTRTH